MLSSRMPDLAALDVLVAVARNGSLTGAAAEVGATQQAVSARIASLENLIGVRLVSRTSRGSELTEQGRLVVGWADRLLQQAAEMDTGLASLREGVRASIRVSASLTVAEQLLPAWLVSMQLAVRRLGVTPPDVMLTATNSVQVAEQVRTGWADLGFVEGPRAPRGLRSRVVAHDELVFVVPRDHSWARRSRGVDAAEVARTPLVVRERGSGTRDFLDEALRAVLGDAFHGVIAAIELSTSAAVRLAVLSGAGPAAMSRLTVADDLASGRLVGVRLSDLTLRRDLRAVWIGGRTPPAGAVRDLLAHIGSSAPAT